MAGGIGRKLTDKDVEAFVKKAKHDAAERGKKLADGQGLHLFVTLAGTPTWRIKYRHGGKEKLFSVGPYPDVPLKQARIELVQVKAWLHEGKDPMDQRRIIRAANAAASEHIFRDVTESWLSTRKKEWSAVHYTKSARALERDVYPTLGKLPISSITPAMVSTLIEHISSRGVVETASRILQHLNGIFRYAQAKELCHTNPAIPAREVLPKKRNSGRMAALIDFGALGEILRRAQAARLSRAVYMAHRLISFSAMRISNVVEAEWQEFDLEAEQPVWTIPRAKLKKKDLNFPDHRVPLAPAIAAELREWRAILGGRSWVFPSIDRPGQPISREALEKVYRVTLGLKNKHTPHGWRASFTSQARDHGFERDLVLLATDHAHDSDVALAYDRGERFSHRVALFTWWGEQLIAAQNGEHIVPLPKKRSAA